MIKEIANWKSVRRFKPEPVPQEILHTVLQAGRRAPSWKNIQPWRFIAVTAEQDRNKLADIFSMGTLIRKAPAVILCVATPQSWAKEHQRERLRELVANSGVTLNDSEIDKAFLDNELAKALEGNHSALMARTFENIGIAYGFIILEAMHQGLGACIVGELDNDLISVNKEKYNEVKATFGVADTEIITAAIIIGYPAKDVPLSPRKPENEVIVFHS